MKSSTTIKFKAAFLLVVFALNTIVGFACSMDVNMGFNSHHHDEAPVHIHAKGKPHHHHKDKHQHSHGKDNCCNDSVVKFQQVDKNRAPAAQAAPEATAILFTSFFNIDNLTITPLSYAKRIIRYYHPPPPDIRIFIQSFQI